MSAKKKRLIVYITAGAVAVLLLVAIMLVIFRQTETQPQTSEPDTEPGQSVPMPEDSSIPLPPSNSSTDSIPYIPPIDSPILGKWEEDFSYMGDELSEFPLRVKFEFFSDGTCVATHFDPMDEDYPENWKTFIYNYRFDTYRGEEVMYCDAFGRTGYPQYLEFYTTEDDREAVCIYDKNRDGSTYMKAILLRSEEE